MKREKRADEDGRKRAERSAAPSSLESKGEKMNKIKCDSKGVPFEFPTCLLEPREYAKIISEINTNYALYANEMYGIHGSIGIDGRYYLYYFENRGFDDYNVYGKFDF